MSLQQQISFELTPSNEIAITAPKEMEPMVEYMYEADRVESWDDFIGWLEDTAHGHSYGYNAYSAIIKGDMVWFMDQMGNEDEDEDVGFKTTRAEFLPVAKAYRDQLKNKPPTIRPQQVSIADRVTGSLFEPVKAKTLLVICHGYKSSNAHPTIRVLTEVLGKKGNATYSFNFSGEQPLDIERQVEDICHIVKHFKKYKKIVLIAGSFGALSSAIAAKELPVQGLVTINGFFGTMPAGALRKSFIGFRLLALVKPEYKQIVRYYKRELQPQNITAPVLVIHTKADTVVPFSQSQKFFGKLGGPKQFLELQTANHDLVRTPELQRVIDEIAAWLP